MVKKTYKKTYFSKPAKILINITETDNTLTLICKKANTSQSYTMETLDDFEKRKLITKQVKGREKIIVLTSKGEEIKNELIKIRNLWREEL